MFWNKKQKKREQIKRYINKQLIKNNWKVNTIYWNIKDVIDGIYIVRMEIERINLTTREVIKYGSLSTIMYTKYTQFVYNPKTDELVFNKDD